MGASRAIILLILIGVNIIQLPFHELNFPIDKYGDFAIGKRKTYISEASP